MMVWKWLTFLVTVLLGIAQIVVALRDKPAEPAPTPAPAAAPQAVSPAAMMPPAAPPAQSQLTIFEAPSLPREWWGPERMIRYDLQHEGTHFDLYVVHQPNVLERVASGRTDGRTLTFDSFYSPTMHRWGDLPQLEVRGNQMIGRAPDGTEKVYLVR